MNGAIKKHGLYSVRLPMGQIGEGVRWTAGILPGWETRRGQAGRLRYVLLRLGLQVSSMAERSIMGPTDPVFAAGSLQLGRLRPINPHL